MTAGALVRHRAILSTGSYGPFHQHRISSVVSHESFFFECICYILEIIYHCIGKIVAGDTSEALGRPLRDSWSVSGDIFDQNQPGMALGRLWGGSGELWDGFWEALGRLWAGSWRLPGGILEQKPS